MSRSRDTRWEGVNLLEVSPWPVAVWSEIDGMVVLELPAPEQPWRTPLAWVGYTMSTKKVRLDDVGSFAWKLFDGRRSVSEVAARLAVEFGERVAPAEERLGELVRMLHRGGMLSYSQPGSE